MAHGTGSHRHARSPFVVPICTQPRKSAPAQLKAERGRRRRGCFIGQTDAPRIQRCFCFRGIFNRWRRTTQCCCSSCYGCRSSTSGSAKSLCAPSPSWGRAVIRSTCSCVIRPYLPHAYRVRLFIVSCSVYKRVIMPAYNYENTFLVHFWGLCVYKHGSVWRIYSLGPDLDWMWWDM